MTQEIDKIYLRVLKYGLERRTRRLLETFTFIFTIFAITLLYFYFLIRNDLSAIGKYIFFPFGILAEIILILSYIENHYNINIFGENATKFFSTISIVYLVLIVIYAAIPGFYPNKSMANTNTALIVLFFLITIIETGYFIFSTYRADLAEGSFGLEHQFKVLETKLDNRRLGSFNFDKAINQGVNAIKTRINVEGFWSEYNPRYDTALVLEFFHHLGYELNTPLVIPSKEGKKVVKIKEIVEKLIAQMDTMEYIELNYENFFVLYTLSLYDPTILDRRMKELEDYYESIKELTEWDFIGELNRFTPNMRATSTPIAIIMPYLADQAGYTALLDKLAALFSASIDIIIKRGYARFSSSKTGKTPIEMLARLILALTDIRRPSARRQAFLQAVTNTQFIEGSWSGNVGTTGYVIQALLPIENADSIILKKAANYLLAVQDKDGMWGASLEETTIVLKALIGLKKMAEQEEVIT